MGKYKKYVPDGVEDCLPKECYLKRQMEDTLRSTFIVSGYEEIETPTQEFYDAFQSGVGAYMQENMVKLMDGKGRILVLRPDITVPIARVAATKLKGGVQRLCYIQNAYASAAPAFGKAGEFTQAGIELIGDESYFADVEVITLAIKSLKAAGLEAFTLDIGQVQYFKGLINELDLQENEIDELRHAIDSKDLMSIDAAASQLGINEELKEKLQALPQLFGGEEVFEKALALSDNEQCFAAVENLRNVYALLKDFGLEEYISIDLAMLHDIAYYSGIIFRGITHGIGFPVAMGGRYDALLEKFGEKASATGFALNIKRIMIAMERQQLLSGFYETYAVVSCDPASSKKAYEYVENLRSKGKRTVFVIGLTKQNLMEQKKDINASAALFFDADGSMVAL